MIQAISIQESSNRISAKKQENKCNEQDSFSGMMQTSMKAVQTSECAEKKEPTETGACHIANEDVPEADRQSAVLSELMQAGLMPVTQPVLPQTIEVRNSLKNRSELTIQPHVINIEQQNLILLAPASKEPTKETVFIPANVLATTEQQQTQTSSTNNIVNFEGTIQTTVALAEENKKIQAAEIENSNTGNSGSDTNVLTEIGKTSIDQMPNYDKAPAMQKQPLPEHDHMSASTITNMTNADLDPVTANNTSSDSSQKDDETNKTLILNDPATLLNTKTQVITVSDASSKIAQPVSRQIAQEAVNHLQKGISEFNMDLYPKDLGKISVKMATQDGILTVVLSSTNPKTQSLLASNADSIRSILQTTQERPIQISCEQQQSNYQNPDEHSSHPEDHQKQQQQSAKQNDEKLFASTEKFLSFLQQIHQTSVQGI